MPEPLFPERPELAGYQKITPDDPFYAEVLANTEAHYERLRREHPEVWAEIERNRANKPEWAKDDDA
jgi:hypothetical protein